MRILIAAIAFLLISACDDSSGPYVAPELANKVVSGRLEGVSADGNWVWGDGVNQLCQQWSQPGFFYGTEYASTSSADVTVLFAPDILELVDAESLDYRSDYVYAPAGYTVVFRGRNGFFGAWKIDEITDDGLINGTWFFKAGGGGDFTGELVEIDEAATRAYTNCYNT